MENRPVALLDSPIFCRSHVRYTPTLLLGSYPFLQGGNYVANRRNTARRSPRETKADARQLSFVVRDAEPSNEPAKLALHIPPPSSPVSAVRRLDLAARWAADLGELAAELVSEGKLEVERGRTAARTKERTR